MTHSPAISHRQEIYASVITPYTAKRPAELTLKIGDKVKVTKQGPKNWIGTLNGKVGSFPGDCVQVDEGMENSGKPQDHRPSSTYTPIPSKPITKKVDVAPRAHSNYTPSTSNIPPPFSTSPSVTKIFPTKLPPPPSSLVVPSHLPSFSEVSVDYDEPDAPPRSPKRALTKQDLPTIAPRPGANIQQTKSNTDIVEEKDDEKEESDSVPSSPVSKKRSKDDLRKECITEIYQTEKDYILDLEIMIDVFIFPLRTMGIIDEQELKQIFSNVEVLIHCNKEMLKQLESVIGDNSNGKFDGDIQIGEIFTKLSDYFKMYKVFCANQQNSLSSVDTYAKKNAKFKKNLEVCHGDPRCRGLFLQSFLIKPIQRVCKYPLLLRELIRYTPEEHPDFQPLQNAFEKINAVVANINEGQRQAEGLQRIIDLQKLIDGVDSLVAPGRNFKKEGELSYYKSSKSKHAEKRHVFFFSDLILVTIKRGEKKFEHKLSISLENCTLTVLADSTHIKNSFELVQGKKKHAVKCILGCDTPKECHEWVRNIKQLIKEYQKRKLNEIKKLQERGLTPIE